MQIDWLTVSAQWVNFLILIWLLHRFLYQPIVQAMDRRQQAIAARTEEAQHKAEQAEQLSKEYRDKLNELDAHRSELMAAAQADAATEREKLVELARSEIKAMSEQWRHEVEREKVEFQAQLNRQLGHLITATARKVVHDLSNLELEQAVFDNFLERLQRLPVHEKQLLSQSSNDDLVLTSSFELNEALRVRFVDTLKHTLASNPKVQFKLLPDSICGLMLSSPGYTLEWGVDSYFDNLEAELKTVLTLTGQSKAFRHVE